MLNKVKNLPISIISSLALLTIWELILIFQSIRWPQLILLAAGAIIGYLILELDILFPKKEILQVLPLILIPLTLFILTSTAGLLGKGIIVFLNLRLIINQYLIKNDNQDKSK